MDAVWYRNWDRRWLLVEAVAIGLLLGDAKSLEEAREEAYAKWTRRRFESSEEAEEIVDFVMECSEYPIVVDLSAKCVYVDNRFTNKLPAAEVFTSAERRAELEAAARRGLYAGGGLDYGALLSYCLIDLRAADREEFFRLLREYPEHLRGISEWVTEAICGKDAE